jgi:hypothetical protein
MNVLAVDPGSTLGWALSMNGIVESGVEDFSLRRGESPGARFLRFRRWLFDIDELAIRTTGRGLALVVYEMAHHRGGAATEVACGFTTRLQEHAAATSGCECVAVHSARLKKATTGRGNVGKAEMVAAARKRWNLEPTDDNHADALCLLALALELYGPAASTDGNGRHHPVESSAAS